MKMNPPSIYSAFGDKKSLFLKTLDLYVGDLGEIRSFMDDSPSSMVAIREMLRASVLRFTGAKTPRGCMLASATASCSAESEDVRAAASKKRALIEDIICARIQKDIDLKLISKSAPADSLSAFTIVVIQGLSVLARDGASRKKLDAVVEMALLSFASLQPRSRG